MDLLSVPSEVTLLRGVPDIDVEKVMAVGINVKFRWF